MVNILLKLPTATAVKNVHIENQALFKEKISKAGRWIHLENSWGFVNFGVGWQLLNTISQQRENEILQLNPLFLFFSQIVCWVLSLNLKQKHDPEKHEKTYMQSKLSCESFFPQFSEGLCFFGTCSQQEQIESCKHFVRWWLTSSRTTPRTWDLLLAHHWIQSCKFLFCKCSCSLFTQLIK